MRNLKWLLPACFVAVITVFNACKSTKPAEALVYVVDTLGNPVAGARVILRNDSVTSPTTGAKADVYQEDVSDAAGQAYFIFDLEAVLFVEASKGALSGRDYIRLEQSKQVDKTIVIK